MLSSVQVRKWFRRIVNRYFQFLRDVEKLKKIKISGQKKVKAISLDLRHKKRQIRSPMMVNQSDSAAWVFGLFLAEVKVSSTEKYPVPLRVKVITGRKSEQFKVLYSMVEDK